MGFWSMRGIRLRVADLGGAWICRPCGAGFTRVRRVNERCWGLVFYFFAGSGVVVFLASAAVAVRAEMKIRAAPRPSQVFRLSPNKAMANIMAKGDSSRNIRLETVGEILAWALTCRKNAMTVDPTAKLARPRMAWVDHWFTFISFVPSACQ